MLSANPISAAIDAIATTVGREVVVLADDDGGPGLASLSPAEGDAVVLCDHDAPDAPQFLRDALASPASYVAMMASRRRAERMLADLAGRAGPREAARAGRPQPRRQGARRDRAVGGGRDRRRVLRTARRADARLTLADLSWQVLVVLGLAAVMGAFVQAVVGLGMGLVAAPVVGLLAPSLVPTLPLWLALLISGLMLAGERAHIDWRALAWALPARVPGTLVGAWLVLQFTEEQIGIALALMTLVAVGVAVRAAHIPVTPAHAGGRRASAPASPVRRPPSADRRSRCSSSASHRR